MKKLFFILLTFSSLSFSLNSPLLFDRHFSPYASSYDLLFVENKLMGFQNRYKDYLFSLKNPDSEKKDIDLELKTLPAPPIGVRLLGRSFRLLELSFFWGPLNRTIATTQREIFGHGYRARDLGQSRAQVIGYQIKVPVPFGKGGGLAEIKMKEPANLLDKILIDIAGAEANSILAHHTTLSWLSKNRVDGRQASLRIATSLDLPLTILSLEKAKDVYSNYTQEKRHDSANYLMELNFLYPTSKSLKAQLSSLRERAALMLFTDLITYYAIASKIQYIWNGKALPFSTLNTPIRFYMPVYRLSLSPFGPENVFENYLLLTFGEPSYFYFKRGSFSQNTYFGFGFENQGIVKLGSHLFGIKFDFWNQPKLIESAPEKHCVRTVVQIPLDSKDYHIQFNHEKNGYKKNELFNSKMGSAFSIIYQYEFDPAKTNSLYTQLGFKTRGYLPGESIQTALILRGGLSLYF